MEQQNLFAEDWINCLRAHYAHVIREQDTNNEQSLVSVLLETGFSEEDITTMHTEVVASLGWQDEPAEPERTIAEEAPYDWVIPTEPEIVTVEETAYEWVVQPETQIAEAAIEPNIEASAEIPESISDVAEVETESDEDEEPPENLVQMSLF